MYKEQNKLMGNDVILVEQPKYLRLLISFIEKIEMFFCLCDFSYVISHTPPSCEFLKKNKLGKPHNPLPLHIKPTLMCLIKGGGLLSL